MEWLTAKLYCLPFLACSHPPLGLYFSRIISLSQSLTPFPLLSSIPRRCIVEASIGLSRSVEEFLSKRQGSFTWLGTGCFRRRNNGSRERGGEGVDPRTRSRLSYYFYSLRHQILMMLMLMLTFSLVFLSCSIHTIQRNKINWRRWNEIRLEYMTREKKSRDLTWSGRAKKQNQKAKQAKAEWV